jgi:hypothetical protein
MDNKTKKILVQLEELRDYISETAGNSYDEGYVTGLDKAILIVKGFKFL